jgi:hypothetical protein
MGVLNKARKGITLQEVTSLLNNLRLPIAMVFTPVNLKSEKKKFFDSDTYNPDFQYKIVKNNNDDILKKLSYVEEIIDVDPRISDFYVQLISSKKEANDLMHAVGNNELVTEISYNRYGKSSAILFRNACRVLRGRMSGYDVKKSKGLDKGKILGYKEIEKVFRVVFDELGLEDWAVAESKNISKNSIKVGIKSKKVFVDPNIERTQFKLRKTIIHEVGTHVLRATNGRKAGFDALSKANLPSYLDVEEGLATWNEQNLGLLTDKWLAKKAALTYALYIGEDMSFRQLYNALLGVLPKYGAFSTTYRVKKGLKDTSYRGLYTKDIVYFRGFRRVMRKLEKDPSLYELLYAGKIDFKQTEWVREGLIPKPDQVPGKEKWQEIFKKAGI